MTKGLALYVLNILYVPVIAKFFPAYTRSRGGSSSVFYCITVIMLFLHLRSCDPSQRNAYLDTSIQMLTRSCDYMMNSDVCKTSFVLVLIF